MLCFPSFFWGLKFFLVFLVVLCSCAMIIIPHICEWLICLLIRLTPYSAGVLTLHQSFFSLCLDVSLSCGQNIVASHNGISFCGGNMCMPGDQTMAFCMLLCQVSGTDSYHPHIAVSFLQCACPKFPVWNVHYCPRVTLWCSHLHLSAPEINFALLSV